MNSRITSSEIDTTNPEDLKERFEAEADRHGIPRRHVPAAMGDNKKRVGGVAVDQLRSIIDRVERLEQEKAGLAADIRDVFAEAKGRGWDIPAIRKILKLRKMDASEREEAETVLEVYLVALGMQADLFDDEEPAA